MTVRLELQVIKKLIEAFSTEAPLIIREALRDANMIVVLEDYKAGPFLLTTDGESVLSQYKEMTKLNQLVIDVLASNTDAARYLVKALEGSFQLLRKLTQFTTHGHHSNYAASMMIYTVLNGNAALTAYQFKYYGIEVLVDRPLYKVLTLQGSMPKHVHQFRMSTGGENDGIRFMDALYDAFKQLEDKGYDVPSFVRRLAEYNVVKFVGSDKEQPPRANIFGLQLDQIPELTLQKFADDHRPYMTFVTHDRSLGPHLEFSGPSTKYRLWFTRREEELSTTNEYQARAVSKVPGFEFIMETPPQLTPEKALEHLADMIRDYMEEKARSE